MLRMLVHSVPYSLGYMYSSACFDSLWPSLYGQDSRSMQKSWHSLRIFRSCRADRVQTMMKTPVCSNIFPVHKQCRQLTPPQSAFRVDIECTELPLPKNICRHRRAHIQMRSSKNIILLHNQSILTKTRSNTFLRRTPST